MDIFHRAKSVRLRSHHDKYLLAEDDQETVFQDRQGTIRSAKWTVELVEGGEVLRLKSCYGKYLTASNMPFLLGMRGKKVLQTMPRRLDSSIEWEPIREGSHVKLKTRYGQYLRANSGVPPWRNTVTHDIPHRSSTKEWILWDVDVIEIRINDEGATPPPAPANYDQPTNHVHSTPSCPPSPTPSSYPSPRMSRMESNDSFPASPPKNEGRTIYYSVADDDEEESNIDETEMLSLVFKGNTVVELKEKLEEVTGLPGIVVCSKNPLNGKLYPLRLHLPPSNTTMHVVVVPSSGKT